MNGQQQESVISGLRFNATTTNIINNNKSRRTKRPMDDETILLSSPSDANKPTPQILPKRVNKLKSELSTPTTTLINNRNDDYNIRTCDIDNQRAPGALLSPAESFTRLSSRGSEANCFLTHSPHFRRENSARSLKSTLLVAGAADHGTNKTSSECSSPLSTKPHSDAASVRSWASVGMGSTDGKKMIIRRVPTSPVELFNIVNPPTPPEEYLYDVGSDDGSGGDDDDSVYMKPRRQHWSNKLQFVLACVGYSVGLGSVWRFPYLCYKSGGGAFLIPYFIMMVVCGVPMLYMELSVGQFTGRGPIGALGHLCPLLKGTGLGSVVISFLMSTYYSVIIAYGIYYFFTSFKAKQPWEDCTNRWNTDTCWVPSHLSTNISRPSDSQTPAEQFYDKKVLQIADGIEHFGSLRWELVACLVCAWVLVYFAIWKSIKSSAKVRYITATLPFLLIIVFLAKSLTLEGADKGMRYFFRPRFESLLEAKVWVNAAAQTFNSMGIAFGSMISFASYNKYNNNILHDTLAVSFVNAITSLLVGIFAFATIGNIAKEQNTRIEDVIDDGPGLIFVVYPQAMAKMPAAQLWAVLFFFMLICLSLNSQFAIVEVVVTSIQDGFPVWIKKNLMCHEVLVLVICVVSLLCGLPHVTQGGIYFFQLVDHYAASISIMYLAFFEVVAIAWFYGVGRLSKNVKTMTGRHPGMYFKFCWLIATPLLIFSVWVFCMIDYEAPTYNNGSYQYPKWAIGVGWVISSLSILCIPICMVYVFIQAAGDTFFEKLKNSLKSDLYEKCPKCEELDCDCVIKVDEIEPMLVMHHNTSKPDFGKQHDNNLSSISPSYYTQIGGRFTVMEPPGGGAARLTIRNNLQKMPAGTPNGQAGITNTDDSNLLDNIKCVGCADRKNGTEVNVQDLNRDEEEERGSNSAINNRYSVEYKSDLQVSLAKPRQSKAATNGGETDGGGGASTSTNNSDSVKSETSEDGSEESDDFLDDKKISK